MKKQLLLLPAALTFSMIAQARTMYVATDGQDTNTGEIDAPYGSIHKAVELAEPGDIIYVRGGVYHLTSRIKIDKAGREDAYISLIGYPGENPILDGSGITYSSVNDFKMSRCIYVNHFGDYWHFKNLELCNAPDNGMKLEGSYCIVEQCRFHDNNDTGLQIGMYKDFSIEETKSFPISGSPEFNPGYTYCKYNTVINCDSWNNYDSRSFNGSDDGGDADGFACKLFPGPGTEFHGCRAWNNSDDNWDLYMVYHPILISDCWNWNGGKDKDGISRGNGNGFKLGGGGTSGGAAFSQSVGAHVVKKSVSFNNDAKGFDQNNAYEAMYILNNVAWGNDYNYRFPTKFEYGTMYMRNNVGFNPQTSNHEFLSVGKDGYKEPDTQYNSWTAIDGCDAIKDGNKVNGTKVYAKDHSSDFISLLESEAKAERQADGSLPENDFARLASGSVFVDAGQIIENLVPQSTSPGGVSLPAMSIAYNDASADMGAFETGVVTKATLALSSGQTDQVVYQGEAIQPTVYKWGGAATDVVVSELPAGLVSSKNTDSKTVTISGIPTAEGSYTVSNVGGENTVTLTGTVKISTEARATLTISEGVTSQEVIFGESMQTLIFTWGGGASDVTYTSLPDGVQAVKDAQNKTLTISGIPASDGTFLVSTVGGMEGSAKSYTCSIIRVYRTKVLTGDWYHIQDEWTDIPADLQGVVAIQSGSDEAYPTVWNPAYVESTGSAPTGCTTGAVNVERGGSVTWTLPSLVEMKLNVHFTGSRVLKLDYTVGTGETKTWTSDKLSKQTLANWDIMSELGLEATRKPVTIKFYHTSTNGGLRLYDFYIKTYDNAETGISQTQAAPATYRIYTTQTAVIVYGEMSSLQVYNTSGSMVAQSELSHLVDIASLPRGIYVLRMTDVDGRISSRKFIKK